MSPWGWQPERTLGIWRHGAAWLRPIVAAAPYVTVLVLLMTLRFVGETLAVSKGVLFDLPEGDRAEGEVTELVALVMPTAHETLVFFDDSRYLLDDAASARSFGTSLSERLRRSERKTLLVLADRRVAGGELMKLASIARSSGADKLLFAEKHGDLSE